MVDSSLHELQSARGAVFSPCQSQSGGSSQAISLPLHFGDSAAEYKAATTTAALFDLGDRVLIEVTGNDRVKFLHNFCTNDIKNLSPGSGCEAFVTNVKGRILGHIFVFAGESSLWVESGPGSEDTLLAHLERYIITEDVQLQPRTAELAEFYVCGPQAAEKLSKLIPQADELPLMGHTILPADGTEVVVRRVDLTLPPGFLISIPRTEAAALWKKLHESGIVPAGSQVFEALRIEAGMPMYGVDLNDDNLAQEAGRTSRAISFKKGCYLGQEPIARLDALGHVNRELRGLRLDALPVPPAGSQVVSADGKEVGTITSSALSYAHNCPVALAMLRSQLTKPGTQVSVISNPNEESIPATVFWPIDR